MRCVECPGATSAGATFLPCSAPQSRARERLERRRSSPAAPGRQPAGAVRGAALKAVPAAMRWDVQCCAHKPIDLPDHPHAACACAADACAGQRRAARLWCRKAACRLRPCNQRPRPAHQRPAGPETDSSATRTPDSGSLCAPCLTNMYAPYKGGGGVEGRLLLPALTARCSCVQLQPPRVKGMCKNGFLASPHLLGRPACWHAPIHAGSQSQARQASGVPRQQPN